ncbi:MAG TPA: CHAT domain-containing tetratricopeptide repeat protein [Streptosporangiaceae bacterium]|nr:CHAT domain-containing tetratricopeptide repeat protein [Streptosporangiaceae bacterium]
MASRARPVTGRTEEARELLHLAGGRPREAMTRCQAILEGSPPPYEASVARQAMAIVLRDFGDTDAAIGELRAALRLARATASPGRQADVLATLGATLLQGGQSLRGLAALDASLRLASGPEAGQILVRRGISLWILGRYTEALADLRRALRLLRDDTDGAWPARALTTRALVHLARGATSQAKADLDRADNMLAASGQELESAYIWHNRGLVAFRSGDLPGALSFFDEADRRYQRLMVAVPDLAIDRCAVLLAAGLHAEALSATEAALGLLPPSAKPTTKAELLLSAARAALAAAGGSGGLFPRVSTAGGSGGSSPRVSTAGGSGGSSPRANTAEVDIAAARARAAHAMFAAQRRPIWTARARLLLLQARYAACGADGRLLRQAELVASELERLASDHAPEAQLLSGRIAAALGRSQVADSHFAKAARARHRRVPPLTRLHGWLAEALRAQAAGDRRRLLAACRAGLTVLDAHRLTLGASELRAQAASQSAELAALALRAALASGRPRLLLAWSERSRAAAQALPPTRPVGDPVLQADLTALRDITSRLDRATADREHTRFLRGEQARLEAAVRARVLRTRAEDQQAAARPEIETVLAELDGTRLIEIVDVDGDLHVLACQHNQVRLFRAGRADDAATELSYAGFGLRRLAHSRWPDPSTDGGPNHRPRALAGLEASGARLESLLLGPARDFLGDGPVVIVPPGRLHAIPWSLLPSLRDRPVSVAPSATAWLRARLQRPPPARPPVLIAGPGLGAGPVEVRRLAASYEGATVLGSGTATASRVLDALDGVPLAHIAAHGTFRADSPLFSSLQLDDGPLTVHDLEGLHRAPYLVILSSCDSAALAPVGADELLGLASALAPRGTAGILASVGPVNDRATTQFMLALHAQLRQGRPLAEAAWAARTSLAADPVAAATGWSFIAIGGA